MNQELFAHLQEACLRLTTEDYPQDIAEDLKEWLFDTYYCDTYPKRTALEIAQEAIKQDLEAIAQAIIQQKEAYND
uniref:Uncharacterized protein n=1 Tax=viral metagenome TaxID=1070528 RepID=A0A6M3JVR3_9ZZZZ